MKRIVASLASLYLFYACDDGERKPSPPLSVENIRLQKFTSCEELEKARTYVSPPSSKDAEFTSQNAEAPVSNGDSQDIPLGETNNQVGEVDELDTTKADQDFIFHVSTQTDFPFLFVLKRSPAEEVKVLQKIGLKKIFSRGLFVTRTKVVVLAETRPPYIPFDGPFVPLQVVPGSPGIGPQYSPEDFKPVVHIYYFSRNQDGTLTEPKERTLEGRLVTARLIEPFLHLGIKKDIGFRYENQDGNTPVSSLLPKTVWIADGEEKPLCKCPEIWYEPASANPNEIDKTIVSSVFGVVSLDLEKPEYEPKKAWIAGSGSSTVYVSKSNFFISTYGWKDTPIHQFQLANQSQETRFVGSAFVKGSLLNQFSLDEHNDHLRVATTLMTPTSSDNMITIFKLTGKDLEPVGQVSGLGKERERIYAVRFLEDRGFLVTFRQTDPLYVLNLKDPANPSKKGELSVPGFSAYLHPMSQDHLLGIGKAADETGRVKGLSMSIFKVVNLDAPELLHKVEIGATGTDSEALSDHKAFRYDADHDLLIFPIQFNQIGKYPSSFQIYRATPQNGFQLLGESSQGQSYSWKGSRSFISNELISMIGGGEMVLRSVEKPDTDLARITIE